ncbi:MAG: hypothetical protein C9356_15140 [Oleiphilus sp.]|nr:MAG: hypothetical protein C9356_15140 [Oleiphilus sp.]
MSHIVRAQLKYAYSCRQTLLKAMEGLGQICEKEKLYQVGAGMTRNTYDLVLIGPSQKADRLGFSLHNGRYLQYQEAMSSAWQRTASAKIQDRYCAFVYQEQLAEQGFDTELVELDNGMIQIQAVEAA